MSIKPKIFKAKLFFAIEEKEKDFVISQLLDLKNQDGNIKAFNSYIYDAKIYVNIYLKNPIKSNEDFKELTHDFNIIFNRVYLYKYKNQKNELLFYTLYKKGLNVDTTKYIFIDDE